MVLQLVSRKTKVHGIYVLPAFLLSDAPTHEEDTSSLRADASADGRCYVQVVRPLFDGEYLTKVAASPEQLTHGYTLILSENQIDQGYQYQA